MESIRNLDLLSVGAAISAIGVLGFTIFLNNRKSITNKTFLLLSISIVFWSIFNYLAYQFHSAEITLWLLRLVIFFAVWFAFFIFQFLYVFPEGKVIFSRRYKFILLPLVIFISLFNLTPFVFSEVAELSSSGGAARVINGPGIMLFGIMVMSFNISGIVLLLRKVIKARDITKLQFKYVLVGFAIMLFLIVTFNFILPAFFDNPRFIPLGAVFIFPFIAFTSYAILKHRLLNVRIIATEILAFILSIATLFELILADDIVTRVFRFGVFLLVLGFGILLIRSVRREVAQRERLEVLTKELEFANAKLVSLNELMAEFLRFAAHQVKSPMGVVKGYAQLIADGTEGAVSDKARETAVKIKAQADRMIALVNNILDVGRIEEGKMEFKFVDVDIVALVRGMVEDYKMLAMHRDLEFSFSSSAPSITVKADEEKIQQVIQNVIDNALKYTEQGYVKVTVAEERASGTGLISKSESLISKQSQISNLKSQNVLITVEDSGKGLSKELQAKLFGRFVRDEQTSREVQGTGLGLYIAKQIVEAHHGEIWAESEGEGKGSRFFVRLGMGID